MTEGKLPTSSTKSAIPIEESFKLIKNEFAIVEVYWNKNLEEVDVEHLEFLKEQVGKIDQGKKQKVYIDTFDFLSITSEGRAYSAKKENNIYTLANAVLIDSIAKRIVFNFFVRLNKPPVPTKGFANKEDAINWLRTL